MKNFFKNIRRRLFIFAINILSPDAVIMIADFNPPTAKMSNACSFIKGHKAHLISLFSTVAGDTGVAEEILIPSLAVIASKKLENLGKSIENAPFPFVGEMPVHANKKQKTVN